MAITVEIYEEIRQCREKYGYGQRQTARLLKVSRNTVKNTGTDQQSHGNESKAADAKTTF